MSLNEKATFSIKERIQDSYLNFQFEKKNKLFDALLHYMCFFPFIFKSVLILSLMISLQTHLRPLGDLLL